MIADDEFRGMLLVDAADDEPDVPMWDFDVPGEITFLVLTNHVSHQHRWPWRLWRKGKHHRTFEVEILDCEGCADWAAEGMGHDYWIQEYVDLVPLKIGGIYTVYGMEVHFSRGDGWTTDDDEEWDYEGIRRHFHPGHRIAGLLISAWTSLTWRFRRKPKRRLW